MSKAYVVQTSNGLALKGELDSQTGPVLRIEGQKLVQASPLKTIVLDLKEVTRSSSVGLSLLLSFMRDANRLGKNLSISSLPKDMRQIAMVSGVLKVLPLIEAE